MTEPREPANILVAEVDGVAQPKIIDFGVGTAIGPSAHPGLLTPAGTPEYMSPEQGNDQAARPDSRSDVYSLGRVLYELVSEQLPRTDGSHFRSRDQNNKTPHSTLQIAGLEAPIQRRILAERGRLWGQWLLTELEEPHREIYVPLHNLGRIYRALDRGEDAVPLMQRALAGRIELYGEDSLIALESHSDLAGLYRGLGRYDEAVEMYEVIVDVYKRVAGLRHGSTLIGMNNLARTYDDTGQHEDSVDLLNYVVEHADEAFGDNNWHGAAFQINLASSLIALGQPSLALEWSQRARPLIEKTFPPEHNRIRALDEHEQRARTMIQAHTNTLQTVP